MPPKSSRFRGVTLFKPTGKWRAQISAGARAIAAGRSRALFVTQNAARRRPAPCAALCAA
jgi:hypothetical protein